jgi:hypothetical protein
MARWHYFGRSVGADYQALPDGVARPRLGRLAGPRSPNRKNIEMAKTTTDADLTGIHLESVRQTVQALKENRPERPLSDP